MSVRDVYEPKDVGRYELDEGYGCICGFKTSDRRVFQNHLLLMGAQEAGHKSLGRINLQTGEVLRPPWKQTRKHAVIGEINLKMAQKTMSKKIDDIEKLIEKQKAKETMRTISAILEIAQKIIEKEMQS